MRNLLICTVLLSVITASCKKVKCSSTDIWIRFSSDTLQPLHSALRIKTYNKGADWSYPSKTETMNTGFGSISNIMMINANNDYMVEIDSPYKQYKITDLAYGDDKTYETGIGQDRINCTNSISCKVNDVSMKNKMATGDKKDFAKQYITLSRY